MKKTTLTPEAFVRAWERAGSVEDVCDATGLSRRNVVIRSWAYRKAGVNLKQLLSDALQRRGRKPTVNAGALNKVIAGLRRRKSAK